MDRAAAVALEPRDDVTVDVGHFLAGFLAVVERDRRGVGVDALLDGGHQPVDRRVEVLGDVVRDVVQSLVLVFRDDQRVPRRQGIGVEEGDRRLVFVHDSSGDLPLDDLAEDRTHTRVCVGRL